MSSMNVEHECRAHMHKCSVHQKDKTWKATSSEHGYYAISMFSYCPIGLADILLKYLTSTTDKVPYSYMLIEWREEI